MKARVHVTYKPVVLDPQGEAVKGALHSLGFEEVEGARVGRVIELTLGGNPTRQEAEARVAAMCDRLLANPVIEDYALEIGEE